MRVHYWQTSQHIPHMKGGDPPAPAVAGRFMSALRAAGDFVRWAAAFRGRGVAGGRAQLSAVTPETHEGWVSRSGPRHTALVWLAKTLGQISISLHKLTVFVKFMQFCFFPTRPIKEGGSVSSLFASHPSFPTPELTPWGPPNDALVKLRGGNVPAEMATKLHRKQKKVHSNPFGQLDRNQIL